MDVESLPLIVSVDDHLVEPPDLWQERVAARYREDAPRVVSAPYRTDAPRWMQALPTAYEMADEGPVTDFWVFEGQVLALTAGFAAAGQDLDETGLTPIRYDQMRPGAYQLDERLRDMDVAGIERSLCFPTVPRFCGQLFLGAKDKDLALACIRAWNDFMVEEWAGASGGRQIPLCIVPLWDPSLAAEEVRRCAARGVRAVSFSELPHNLGLPSLHDPDGHWDPFLRACDETGVVVCMHIGTGARPYTPPEAPAAVNLALLTINAQISLTEWLLSGALARFPDLRLAYSEAQIGWMPYVLEQVDRVWRKGERVSGVQGMDRPPSTYAAERVFGCFFEDDFGVSARDAIGVSQITFECDYPHQDSTWPTTAEYAARTLDGLPPDEVEMILRGNAIRLFQLPETLGAR